MLAVGAQDPLMGHGTPAWVRGLAEELEWDHSEAHLPWIRYPHISGQTQGLLPSLCGSSTPA